MKPTAYLRQFLALAGSGLLAVSSASAADYYWDSNSTTGGFGSANGTWGTSTFWSTDSTGASATANTTILATDDINFGTATLGYTGGRTVTISGTQTAGSVTIGSASGAITFSSGQFDLGNAHTIITQNSASNTTISSVIGGGTNGLTKAGSGRLIVTGVNTYSGNTVVSDGILRFGTSWNNSWASGRLPSNSNLEINNGIVEAYYYLTRTLGTGAGQIQLTGGRSGFTNLQGDATANFVTFGTTGTTVTWGDAAFNPSTFVMNDVGASAVMRIANPFDLNGAERTIEVSATGTGGGRGTYGILTGNLSGTGASLVKTGAGTLMLDGTNTYDGGTTINGGGVWFRDTAAMSATGTVTVNDGGILSVGVGSGLWITGTSGVGTIGGLLAGDGGQTGTEGLVTYNGNVGVGFNISGTQTYAGDIANVTGSTTTAIHIGNKDGSASSDPFAFAGTLTLSGNNTYTGATFVNVGTLIAGSATALGNGGDITFNGGTLQYTASSAATDYGSRIKNSSKAIALNTNAQNVTLSNLASGNTGGLTLSGAGSLTLSGTNSYTGVTTVNGGATLVSEGLSRIPGAITNRGTVRWQADGGGTITNRQENIGRTANATFIFDRATAGAADNWTITPTGNDAGRFNAASGTTVTFKKGDNVTSGTSTVDITTGLHSSESNNPAAITYVADGVNLRINGHTNTRGRNFTFSSNTDGNEIYGAINNSNNGQAVSMTFAGTGTWNLSRAAGNGYTGGTTVSGGTLLVNNTTGSGTGTGAVTVTGGTLGGTGTISGSVTLNNGAFLSPGASIESLATGSNTWNGGSTFVFEFSTDGSTGAAGTEWDLLAITGSLDLSGASVGNPINFDLITMANAINSGLLAAWDPDTSATWSGFVTTTGGITSYAANLFDIDTTGFQNPLNGSFSVAQNGNNLDLVYTAIPEPTAALLGGLGLLLLLRRRR